MSRKREKDPAQIDLALAAWKSARGSDAPIAGPGLSPDARQRLKATVYARQATPPIFGHGFRWALALGLPALAIASILGLQQLSPAVPVETATAAISAADAGAPDVPRIQVSKENGQVIFRIAGSRVHHVAKSDRPDGFAQAGSVQTVRDGQFADSLESGGNLTFYRID